MKLIVPPVHNASPTSGPSPCRCTWTEDESPSHTHIALPRAPTRPAKSVTLLSALLGAAPSGAVPASSDA
eukprot:3278225-Prymnesium_polylepis.1